EERTADMPDLKQLWTDRAAALTAAETAAAAGLAAAGTTLSSLRAAQAAAAELAGATALADRLARWHAALAAEPLASVAAPATEAKKPNVEPCKPARLRVEGDIP